MLAGMIYLTVIDDGQNRLRTAFHDKRIYYGRNVKTERFEAWYKPDSSAPYLITSGVNVHHCQRNMEARIRFEHQRACDQLRKMDEHNDKVADDIREDAMHEIRAQLQSVANGRMLFTPPIRRKAVS